MIRVLIVDNSPTYRLLLKNIISSDPDLQIAGEAINGNEAISKCRSIKPDIIIMDIEIPDMDGYEAIKDIMFIRPCPVIVLTSIHDSIEIITKKAKACGAVMVLAKPNKFDSCSDDFINNIKSMSQVKLIDRINFSNNKNLKPLRNKESDIDIIAIGASTGGPPALQEILSKINKNIPVPILVVQHMARGFISGLASWLAKTTNFKIELAEYGQILDKGTVYLARDDYHLMLLDSKHIYLDPSPEVDGHKPSITKLFLSVAKNFHSKALGIILTGMGNDGVKGLSELKNSGSITIAQDEKSSVVYGMPKEAFLAGAVKKVLPLNQIGNFINNLFFKS